MAKFKYYLEKRKDKDGNIVEKNVPIIYSFSFDGYRLKSTVGERIDKKHWDEDKQRVKGGRLRVPINQRLEAFQAKLEKLYRESVVMEEQLTPEIIKKKLTTQKNSGRKLDDFFEEFIEESKNSCSLNTIKNYKTVQSHLKNYATKKKKAFHFNDFTPAVLEELNSYFINEKGLTNNTIAKLIKVFKRFLNWALEKGYHQNTEFKNYSLSEKEGEIVVLNWDELMHLYTLEIKKTYLAHVRDVFCFACLTSLRFSDVENLKRNQITDDFIRLNIIKTKETLNIPLNKYSKAILEKYSELPDEQPLPVISNQKTNKYLKELGEIAKIDEPITIVRYKGAKREEKVHPKYDLLTFHVARKTFITNAFRFDIPVDIIMSISGHKDHRVFKRYNKIAQDQLKQAMNKFNNIGNEKSTN